jgi:hypothetical protein
MLQKFLMVEVYAKLATSLCTNAKDFCHEVTLSGRVAFYLLKLICVSWL